MRHGLTQKQTDALEFIRGKIEGVGIAPSFEEISQHLGVRSKSTVSRIVTSLVLRGHLVKLPNRARSLALAAESTAVAIEPALHRRLSQFCERKSLSIEFVARLAISLHLDRHENAGGQT